MKKKILDFIDKYLLWVLAVGGFVAALYGAWFQTEGFTYPGVPLSMVIASFLFGGILGAALMSYLLNYTKKEVVGGKRLARTELKPMLRGYMVTFVLCMLVVYFARSAGFFYIGLGGMMFSVVQAWYYIIWTFVDKKTEEKKAQEAESGGGQTAG